MGKVEVITVGNVQRRIIERTTECAEAEVAPRPPRINRAACARLRTTLTTQLVFYRVVERV